MICQRCGKDHGDAKPVDPDKIAEDHATELAHQIDKEVILAAANMMSDKGYGLGNEPDYLKFKAGRLSYTLIKYRDIGMPTYTYFWKNEAESIVSPFFDSEKDAYQWIKEQNEYDKRRI